MDKSHTIFEASAGKLRGFLEETTDEDHISWSKEDLHAVFEHQWSAPLAVDLGGLDAVHAERINALSISKGLVLNSFGDLLCHKAPPLPLLKLCKEFAKRCLYSPYGTIPQDVARVLYFASIAAALSRCGTRISTLPNPDIAAGIAWAIDCEWIPKEARDMLQTGLETLEKTE